MKWFFGIITDGRGMAILRDVIQSVIDVSGVTPLVCGNTEGLATPKIEVPHLAKQGRLGAMRNRLVDARGDADMVVIMDDDIILDDNFVQGFDKFGYDGWDVASCIIRNPDGSRYWDWKEHIFGLDRLLPYDHTSPYISLTGGLLIAKSHVFEKCLWDSSVGFYQQEDVLFSDVLRRQNYKIVFNPHSSTTHMGPYTQNGKFVDRTNQ
jgi:glycosyltransferase involved in cell wall biosynthesis